MYTWNIHRNYQSSLQKEKKTQQPSKTQAIKKLDKLWFEHKIVDKLL
jgi:hypothetical protein